MNSFQPNAAAWQTQDTERPSLARSVVTLSSGILESPWRSRSIGDGATDAVEPGLKGKER